MHHRANSLNGDVWHWLIGGNLGVLSASSYSKNYACLHFCVGNIKFVFFDFDINRLGRNPLSPPSYTESMSDASPFYNLPPERPPPIGRKWCRQTTPRRNELLQNLKSWYSRSEHPFWQKRLLRKLEGSPAETDATTRECVPGVQ